jgi:predicted DNA binding CopG/RHH family protein
VSVSASATDVAGNSAVIAHSAVSASTNAKVDTQAPTVSLSANAYRLQASDNATVTLRFDPRLLARIKRVARSRYLNYQSMIKQWLAERLEEEGRD